MGRDRHNKLAIEAVKRRVIAGEEVTLAPSITARGKTIYLHIYYHVRCLKESLRLPLTHSNIEYAIKTLAAIRRSIELTGTFDYETHFPHGRNAHKFGITTTRVTVGQALLAWYETKQDEAAPSTADDYKNSINILIQSFGDITVADLSVQPIQAWVNSRTSSNKRTRNVLTPLRGVLAAAYASRQIKENPLDRVVFPKPKPQQSIDPETSEELSEQDNIVPPFRYDEIEKILSACEALPLFYYYVMLAIATGMRTSELIALRWRHIDFHAGVIKVRIAFVKGKYKGPKTRAGRRDIVMLEPARGALLALRGLTYKRKDDFVLLHPYTLDPWSGDKPVRETFWRPTLASPTGTPTGDASHFRLDASQRRREPDLDCPAAGPQRLVRDP